jgi:WD40 repeat protein
VMKMGGRVMSICFSSDGKYLASGVGDLVSGDEDMNRGKVSVLKGGLCMSLEFLPIDLIFPASKQEPTVPAYCFMDPDPHCCSAFWI